MEKHFIQTSLVIAAMLSITLVSTSASETSLSASIEINVDAEPLKYDPMIFGGFIEHFHRQIYGGIFELGSPLSDENGFRKDVIEALRELKMPIVRWPGGCFASAYHWLDGVGPTRTPAFDKAWRVEDSNTFGTNEFILWCKAVGAEPYICVNAGTGTLEEMSDWVEYCNQTLGKWAALRRKHGFLEPHGVKYWSIGNENYGPWEPQSRTIEEWPMLVREAAQLMQAVDPSIKVFAPVVAREDWAIPTLRFAGRKLDYISIHEYYDALWRQPVASDYLTCMSWADKPEQHMVRTKELLEKAGAEHVRIAFDEWNLRSWHHPNTPGERASAEDIAARDVADENSTYTMADALFSAGFFNACLRHADKVTMANIAPIVNTRGPIFAHPGGIVKRTTFHAMKMYATELEAYVVPLSIESDMLPAPADKVTAVDAIATCNDAQTNWSIAIVNRHPERPASIELGFGPEQVNGTLSASVLAGDGPNAFNDIDQPDRVVPLSAELEVKAGRVTVPAHSVTVLTFSR
jgi:alpha-N-arabinofuranosidase